MSEPTDVLLLPGRMYGTSAPLLMYAGDVAERRGLTVHRLDWQGEAPDPSSPEVMPWVEAQVAPRLDEIGGAPVLIGKSLGTQAAGLAAERSLPAVWLTPLLVLSWVVDALTRTTAPFLLIGGTADLAWDEGVAQRLTPHVLSVPDADHGMYIPGPLTGSVAVLGDVVVAIDDFLSELV
jgi:hypothetical protein